MAMVSKEVLQLLPRNSTNSRESCTELWRGEQFVMGLKLTARKMYRSGLHL